MHQVLQAIDTIMPTAKLIKIKIQSSKKFHMTQSDKARVPCNSLFSLAVTFVTYIMSLQMSALPKIIHGGPFSGEPPTDFTQEHARLSLYQLDERH